MSEFWKRKNYEKEIEGIVDLIRQGLKKSDTKNAVIGLSGGVDSSTVTGLCSLALGGERVYTYFLPTKVTNSKDRQDAELISKLFKTNFDVIPINSPVEAFYETLPGVKKDKIGGGNVQARSRMVSLYYMAGRLNGLVVGTSNKTEFLLGYGTKHGDMACDIAPILHLYKTEVREVARHLQIPDSITSKNPSPGLWRGQTDEGELADKIGIEYSGRAYELYEKIDLFFYYLFDLKNDFHEACYLTNISDDTGRNIINIYHASEHKRRMPLSLLEGFV